MSTKSTEPVLTSKKIHPDADSKLVTAAFAEINRRLPPGSPQQVALQHPLHRITVNASDLKILKWSPEDDDMTPEYVNVTFEFESGQSDAKAFGTPYWRYAGYSQLFYTKPVEPGHQITDSILPSQNKKPRSKGKPQPFKDNLEANTSFEVD